MKDRKMVVCIESRRSSYEPDNLICRTVTVGDLLEALSEFDESTPVMIKSDNGYTYGEIGWDSFSRDYIGYEDDEEDE